MRKNIILVIFISFSGFLFAQQSGQYSTYMLDPVRYNPAYAGLDYALSITGTYRQQWVSFPGAPQSARVSAHLPLYFLRGGAGIQVENESVGAHNFSSFKAAYNYQREFASGVLSLGVGAGMQQFRLKGGELITPNGDYLGQGTITHNDDLLTLNDVSGSSITVDAGVYFQSERLDIGLSIENLPAQSITLENLNYQYTRTYNAYAASRFEVGNSFVIKPSLWFRTDAVENQLDISVLTTYNDNILAGLSFRGYDKTTSDAVVIIAGFNLSESMTIAYAYDIALSPLQTLHNGSHEVVVKYQLNKTIGAGKPPRIIYHPRVKN